MANLGAADVPESLVLAMRALDEVCHIDGSLARVVPWVMSTLRATIAAHGHAGDAPRLTYCRSWQLNERHYGHLTGMAKNDARQKYGANQVQRWRRAWRETPPRMAPDHAARPGIAAAYAAAGGSPKDLPCSESLAATETRVVAYLENRILPQLSRGRTVLVAAHNNVIRTIIHHLDGDGEERADLELQLAALEIPYATPLVYTFALPGGPTGKL